MAEDRAAASARRGNPRGERANAPVKRGVLATSKRPGETQCSGDEAIDLDTTTELQRRSHALLDRYASERADAQRWIRGAVQYFIVTNDASSDFVEGGLEDDRAVMDAVDRWLSGEE